MRAAHIITLSAGLLLVSASACDQSKDELAKTKQDLQTVSTERDGLKSSLDQANAKTTQLTQQVSDLQAASASAAAAAAAAQAAAPAAEPEAAVAKKPVAAKAPLKKADSAKALSAEQKKEIEANPTARSGRKHF